MIKSCVDKLKNFYNYGVIKLHGTEDKLVHNNDQKILLIEQYFQLRLKR